MEELAATGAEGIEILADMLVPAAQGKNAPVEYAINGVASHVTKEGLEAQRKEVCKGLSAALARCTDDANRAFLLSQLQLCATADTADTIAGYFDDPYLSDPALRALTSIAGSEAVLLKLAKRSDITQEQKAALACALGEKEMAEAEQRLKGRNSESDETFRARIEVSRDELAQAQYYDYVIINTTVEDTICDIETILRAEHLRYSNMEDFVQALLQEMRP